MKAVCTALSVVETHCISANMKEEALRMAAFYDGDIKIEINMSKINGLVKISVTEYNI